ncbi:MAG: hypothetical protein ACM3UU_03535 [Ignavibacteriales bacterium]
MKSLSRIVLLIFVMTMMATFFLSIGSVAYAAVGDPPTPGDTGDFSPGKISSQNVDIGGAENGIRKIMGAVFRYIQIGGSIIAVAILALFGIQWFTASVQKKAELKEKLVGYLIGALITFGAAQIMGWMANMVTTVTGTGTP